MNDCNLRGTCRISEQVRLRVRRLPRVPPGRLARISMSRGGAPSKKSRGAPPAMIPVGNAKESNFQSCGIG